MTTKRGSEDIAGLLGRVALLRSATAAARRLLVEGGRLRRYAVGQTLWTAGSDAEGLFIVLDGSVRVVRAPGGRQYAVHTEGPGGTLGDVPFFADGPYPATAIAAQPTICLVVTRSVLRRAMAADPELAFLLLAALANRVRGLVRRLDDRSATTVQQRLARLILTRHASAKGAGFALATTQAEAAEELGTVREVLVRELRRLRATRVLRTSSRGRYEVVNEAALRQLAGRPPSPKGKSAPGA